MKDWHTIKEVRMLGLMKLLMVFDSEENMKEAYRSPFLLNHFLDVRKWTKGETNSSKRSWIEITKNMITIGEVWGRVIKVEEDECGHFNSFKVLIDAHTVPLVQAIANVCIDNEVFRIFVREKGESHSASFEKTRKVENMQKRIERVEIVREEKKNEPNREQIEEIRKDNRRATMVAMAEEEEEEESWVGET
ncbi:hypothetical protein PIB30_025538 [Stylosanthes scabra]|uniref:DUF4283 domain-containing protein n=1 Tax=Stylosanthes scabra TaxID=79078 RepID=A0ABU6Z963_9FABA|nr:hypothetical protein [Stylosanthes scabra]